MQIFFMISGFYMAMIAGKYPSKAEFYVSRFLRIFFPYYIVLFFIVATSLVAGLLTGKWLALSAYSTWSTEQNGIVGTCLAVLSNLTIIGSDWTIFVSHEPGASIAFCSNFHELPNPLPRYLINPPIWSVGVEVMFYLLVPFFTRFSTRQLLGAWLALLAARIGVYEGQSLNFDPWTYRFFPLELSQFFLGMLSYRIYASDLISKGFMGSDTKRWIEKQHYWTLCVCAVVLFWVLNSSRETLAGYIDIGYARQAECVAWSLTVPLLFGITKNSHADRWIGELSYPVYLIHYFVVGVVAATFTRITIAPDVFRGVIVATISVGASILLQSIMLRPFEDNRLKTTRWLLNGLRSDKSLKE